jgi:hypothetical protein
MKKVLIQSLINTLLLVISIVIIIIILWLFWYLSLRPRLNFIRYNCEETVSILEILCEENEEKKESKVI